MIAPSFPPCVQEEELRSSVASSVENASTTLAALRILISLGWVRRVSSLQVASLELLTACREASNFRLRVARKTPRRVWQAKLGGGVYSSGRSSGRKPAGSERSNRLILPRVTRMLYDRPSFDLEPGWALPTELVRLVLGTEFGGGMEGVAWPSALKSVIFWRRYVVLMGRMLYQPGTSKGQHYHLGLTTWRRHQSSDGSPLLTSAYSSRQTKTAKHLGRS